MGVVSEPTHIYYRVIESKKWIGDKQVAIYGIEGSDESTTLRVLGLTYDFCRISTLVDKMNKCQFDLKFLSELADDFFRKYM